MGSGVSGAGDLGPESLLNLRRTRAQHDLLKLRRSTISWFQKFGTVLGSHKRLSTKSWITPLPAALCIGINPSRNPSDFMFARTNIVDHTVSTTYLLHHCLQRGGYASMAQRNPVPDRSPAHHIRVLRLSFTTVHHPYRVSQTHPVVY